MSDVLIITVNFRHADCTLDFLDSASKLEKFDTCHLIIVDNHSEDGSVSRIRDAASKFSNVEFLISLENRGYFGAANWALREFLASHSVPDWVIVCNNDITFEDPTFLLRLMKKDPSFAGVIAPSIVAELTGHDANPWIRHRPSPFQMLRYRLWLSTYYAMWFKQWLYPFVRRARFALRRRKAVARSTSACPIYAPHGAFFIFSRKFFEAGGFIDDGFFMYAEEFSVAEMCRCLGLSIVHDPELKVWHAGGQTTGRMLSPGVYVYQKEGFRYALARYKNSYPELIPARTTLRPSGSNDGIRPTHVSAAGDGIE